MHISRAFLAAILSLPLVCAAHDVVIDRNVNLCVGPSTQTDVIKLLVEKGADVNAKDKRGRSALTHAAHKGNTDLIEYLKSAGAAE